MAIVSFISMILSVILFIFVIGLTTLFVVDFVKAWYEWANVIKKEQNTEQMY